MMPFQEPWQAFSEPSLFLPQLHSMQSPSWKASRATASTISYSETMMLTLPTRNVSHSTIDSKIGSVWVWFESAGAASYVSQLISGALLDSKFCQIMQCYKFLLSTPNSAKLCNVPSFFCPKHCSQFQVIFRFWSRFVNVSDFTGFAYDNKKSSKPFWIW